MNREIGIDTSEFVHLRIALRDALLQPIDLGLESVNMVPVVFEPLLHVLHDGINACVVELHRTNELSLDAHMDESSLDAIWGCRGSAEDGSEGLELLDEVGGDLFGVRVQHFLEGAKLLVIAEKIGYVHAGIRKAGSHGFGGLNGAVHYECECLLLYSFI